tara:strand:+ start:1867 stop:3495 length:1629 start_codon:yes stop_codon:yes gene_type:complete
MTASTRASREALRTLLLPIEEQLEGEALEAAFLEAERQSVRREDFALVIKRELENWRLELSPSQLLIKISKATMEAGGDDFSRLLATEYFSIHKSLQGKQYLLSFIQASSLLCHVRLAATLFTKSNATASQISLLLNARDSRTNASRQSVSFMLRKLKLKAELTLENVMHLYDADEALSQQLLADADLKECSQMVGTVAQGLGCVSQFSEYLDALASTAELRLFTPYIQVLHFQCTVSEYFDATITDLYEFSPRGEVATALFEKYKHGMTDKGNPFLNNMKGVEQITLSWARSRDSKWYSGAIALYSIIDTLQSMGFSARRELSTWLRVWIHRVILLASQDLTELPYKLNARQAENLLTFVKTGNTETSGVLEQRVVDAISCFSHHDTVLWKRRGLTDSVNATNVSRKKLGDCDFQNSGDRIVMAYEAHGGKLTKIYLYEHIRTLKRILPDRIIEWEAFSKVEDWKVAVVFVAHEVADDVEKIDLEIDGVNVSFSATTYEAILDSCSLSDLTPLLDEYVMEVLSKSRVPDAIRLKVKGVIDN